MDYEEIFEECKALFRAEGLPVPRVALRLGGCLSYTYSRKEIFLGWGVRLTGSVRRIRHSVLHEMVHVLMARHPPSWEICSVFSGDRDDWEARQKFSRVLLIWNRATATAYGRTHPCEDLVETAACYLGGESARIARAPRKVQAVEKWFSQVKRRA